MIHPDTELRHVNENIGYGVFATKPIPKGTITWVRDNLDQEFVTAEIERMESPYRQILETYTFIDARGRSILCWDHARFVNHSCDANCLGAGYDFEIAIRDLNAGEALTDDYGTLNLRTPFHCACHSARCRGQITPKDVELLSPDWDAVVRPAFLLIPQVAQPLWGLVEEKAAVEQALKHPEQIRSVLANYFLPVRGS